MVGSQSALDADEDMAYALMAGCWNFKADNLCNDGKSLIKRLMLYEIESSTQTPKCGDGWGGCAVTNPSYFAVAYYPTFSNVTEDSGWLAVQEQCYSIIDKVDRKLGQTTGDSQGTGLLPDWTDCNGNFGASAASFDKDGGRDFWYDAVRTPWRLSTAKAWSCDANTAGVQSQR